MSFGASIIFVACRECEKVLRGPLFRWSIAVNKRCDSLQPCTHQSLEGWECRKDLFRADAIAESRQGSGASCSKRQHSESSLVLMWLSLFSNEFLGKLLEGLWTG